MQGQRDHGPSPLTEDNEANRLSARAQRYARLGVNAGAFAARVGVNRLTGGGRDTDARALASALGSMKGPVMKVAQILTTIPDALPTDYANELIRLQSQAPPMGAGFVRRRMIAELGLELARPLRGIRPQAGRRRFARPGAQRADARGRRGRLQAAISRNGVRGRNRPVPARPPVLAPPAHGRGDRHQRSRARNPGAGARGARLCSRGEDRAPLRPDACRPSVRAGATRP